jgi:hypothetical protein
VLYRATCPRCRLLSALTVLVTCGWARRLPTADPRAARLMDERGLRATKASLVGADWSAQGWAIIPALVKPLLARRAPER